MGASLLDFGMKYDMVIVNSFFRVRDGHLITF